MTRCWWRIHSSRIPTLPPKTQFIKIKFVNQGLDLLNISNIFRDHRVTSKIPQYFENLEPPLICYQLRTCCQRWPYLYSWQRITALFKKGPKYRLRSMIDFSKCRDIVEDTLQSYCKRWSKKKGVGVQALTHHWHKNRQFYETSTFVQTATQSFSQVIEKENGEITPKCLCSCR